MEVIYETVYRVRHELMGHYAAESAAPRTDRELCTAGTGLIDTHGAF